MTEITVPKFFNALTLMMWAGFMLVSILAIVSGIKSISTTNLLLILILATMSMKLCIENAHDVSSAITDAVKTILVKPTKNEE